MPSFAVPLPAAIGSEVVLTAGAHAGQPALVIAWRVTRPPLLVGGALDQLLQVAVLVITGRGHTLWVDASEVTGTSALATFFLPLMAGDLVRVQASGARGEVRGWEVTGRRLGVDVRYHVRLAGTPLADELEVDAGNLQPW